MVTDTVTPGGRPGSVFTGLRFAGRQPAFGEERN